MKFKCHEEVLSLQPMIPPERFDIFPPDWEIDAQRVSGTNADAKPCWKCRIYIYDFAQGQIYLSPRILKYDLWGLQTKGVGDRSGQRK